MNSLRIFGIGSSFGADQIGLFVIERIKVHLLKHSLANNVEIGYYDRPGLHLIELIQDAKEVHLIDAVVTGKPEGFLHRFTDISIFEATDKIFSSHGYGIAEALQLAKTIGQLPEQLIIHGIEIGKQKMLTPIIKEASDILAENIMAELLSFPVGAYCIRPSI